MYGRERRKRKELSNKGCNDGRKARERRKRWKVRDINKLESRSGAVD